MRQNQASSSEEIYAITPPVTRQNPRESLYKSLSGERAPSSATLFKVMKALGFKLTIEPLAGY